MLPLEDVSAVVCHQDMPPSIKQAYVHFLNNAFLETETETKEIFQSPHMWRIFEAHLLDMARFSNPAYGMGLPAFNEYVTAVIPHTVRLFFTHFSGNTGLPITDAHRAIVGSLLDALCSCLDRLAVPSVDIAGAIRVLLALASDRGVVLGGDLQHRAEELLAERVVPAGVYLVPPPPV